MTDHPLEHSSDEHGDQDGEARALSIGVDLGGTNLRVALYAGLAERARDVNQAEHPPGAAAPEALAERKEPVGEPRDPDTMVGRIAGLVDALLEEASAAGATVPVGVGVAAMLRGLDGMVARAPHLRWDEVPFGDLLAARLGPRHPVRVLNDVSAITYGEFALGAGIGADDVLAVYVGTGIGAGLVCNGRLVEGATGCAGEIGHFKVVLGPEAKPCACGKAGCVEAYAGGVYLERRIRGELRGGARSRAVELAGGDPDRVTVAHLDEAAAEGDEYALDLWAEIAPLVGVTLANAVALINPARLILGGGVLSRTPVLRQHIIAAVEIAGVTAALEPLVICEAVLEDDAGLVGAALLAANGAP
jgi:glucokinase